MSIERRKLTALNWNNKKYIVNVTGTGNNTYCYIVVNGQKIIKATSLEVEKDTVIQLYATINNAGTGDIYVNGVLVASDKPATYDYTVIKNCTIELTYNSISYYYWGEIRVTDK